MSTVLATKEKIWTYEDYCNLDDGKRYEVIEGKLIMAPAPFRFHQKSFTELLTIMNTYVKQNKLGEVYGAPFDVILSDDIVLQPDILFVSNENIHILREAGVFGAPDLVVEILSPSSMQRDRYDKYDIYEEFKVKEYWIVDPSAITIDVFTLIDDKYELYHNVEKVGLIKSKVFEDLILNIKEILK